MVLRIATILLWWEVDPDNIMILTGPKIQNLLVQQQPKDPDQLT